MLGKPHLQNFQFLLFQFRHNISSRHELRYIFRFARRCRSHRKGLGQFTMRLKVRFVSRRLNPHNPYFHTMPHAELRDGGDPG